MAALRSCLAGIVFRASKNERKNEESGSLQSVLRIQETIKLLVLHGPEGCVVISPTRKELENTLNEYKFDLMVLTQDLGKVVPSSQLANELESKSKALQEKIDKVELQLKVPDTAPKEEGESRKYVSSDGEVRIWSSSVKKSQS